MIKETMGKWICSGLEAEIEIPVQINYQYDREAEDVVNFQVFCKADTQELHEITEFISIADAEFIRDAIIDAVNHKEY